MIDPRDDPRWTRWNRWELFSHPELVTLTYALESMIGTGSLARPMLEEVQERIREVESVRMPS